MMSLAGESASVVGSGIKEGSAVRKKKKKDLEDFFEMVNRISGEWKIWLAAQAHPDPDLSRPSLQNQLSKIKELQCSLEDRFRCVQDRTQVTFEVHTKFSSSYEVRKAEFWEKIKIKEAFGDASVDLGQMLEDIQAQLDRQASQTLTPQTVSQSQSTADIIAAIISHFGEEEIKKSECLSALLLQVEPLFLKPPPAVSAGPPSVEVSTVLESMGQEFDVQEESRS
jgi:hypothetical protein